MIRKHCNVLLVTALMLSLLTGCRGNVSHREDGMITDPTGSGATVSTTAVKLATADVFAAFNSINEGGEQ